MNLSGLLPLLDQLPAFQKLMAENAALGPSDALLEPQSVIHAAHPYLIAGIATQTEPKPSAVVVVTARSEVAYQLAKQLTSWVQPVEDGGPPIYHFAEPDALPLERISWSSETRQKRLTTLAALQSRSNTDSTPIVVASVRAFLQKTLPAKELRLSLRTLKVGEIVRLEQMVQNWVQTGYLPTDIVEEPGTFARRGGIVDVWPPNLPHPIRIDLFGDEVDSLRIFDPTSQRTQEKVKSVGIGPGSEAISKYGPAVLRRLGITGGSLNAAENISAAEDSSLLQDPGLLLAIRDELRQEVDQLEAGDTFKGIEWYLPYFYSSPTTLLDYLDDNAMVLIDDGAALVETMQELAYQVDELRTELVRSGELPKEFASSFLETDEARQRIVARRPIILGFGDLNAKTTSDTTDLARCFGPGPRFGGKTKQIVDEVQKLRTAGHRVALVTRQAARVQELLNSARQIVHVESELVHSLKKQPLALVQGVLDEGFILRWLTLDSQPTGVRELQSTGGANLHIFSDTELFGWSKPQARRRTNKRSTVAPELFFADVKKGEFVVHLEHGIGLYDGLVKMQLNGVEREYLQVVYAKNDKLFVPVHQADRLSRYVGAGESKPSVTRLGTADWKTVKERAKRMVADIAEDLLVLYAEREMVSGYSYGPDTPWQTELEGSFPFQETLDQLSAVEDVKQDMESPKPMDRLICGDVGYGKTEVAVRAAFKAIADGKQVAMLVPTTVLAQQHFRTFQERMETFPVRVEMLSRFRTGAQQKRAIAGIKDGSVDMVIGTHRLLSQDLDFKDLGLMIIDEEQRFGVSQKERLKQLRTMVDVLTLSATPIPRTLHMSLSGVRDMSTINTPPQARQPVQTVLAEYDEVMVRQAIQRELSRNGQAFFVHNRVRGIEMLAGRLQRLVPDARILIGHGQMPERQLEETMQMFAQGEADVLVCTTIVESGLDIPNANTMIINRADRFGLAQLYQLRGRVGRSAVRGHCYLLYEKNTTLSLDARRRLSAIIESSEELGAGFRIAMRDLEIRGAGDLLGARQSGNIDSVGFDLYTRLLAQAITDAQRKKDLFEKAEEKAGEKDEAEAKAEDKVLETGQVAHDGAVKNADEDDEQVVEAAPFDLNDPLAPPVMLDLPIDAQIPELYVEDESLRLQMYRRIAGLMTPEMVDEMRRELIDRFGVDEETDSVPEEVENLLFQIKVKILALAAGVQNIGRELDQIVVRSEALENMNRNLLQRRLRLGLGHLEDDEFVPDDAARVARRAIYLPVDEGEKWRTVLIRTLQIMAYS